MTPRSTLPFQHAKEVLRGINLDGLVYHWERWNSGEMDDQQFEKYCCYVVQDWVRDKINQKAKSLAK
jgi:hypothetical protein